MCSFPHPTIIHHQSIPYHACPSPNRTIFKRKKEKTRKLGKNILDRSLGVPLDTALVQASINAESNVGRNHVAEALNVLSVNGLDSTKSSRNNVPVQAEEVLGNLVHTGVDIVEAGDEDSILAVGVELLVNGSLGEDGHLPGIHGVLNGSGTVLNDKVGHEAALDDDVELGGSVVDVSSVHATRTEESDSHGSTVADESRHGESSSRGGTATLSLGLARSSSGLEVKDVVARLVEELDALDLGGGGQELRDEVPVAGAGVDGDDGREDVVDAVVSSFGDGCGGGEGRAGEEEHAQELHFE